MSGMKKCGVALLAASLSACGGGGSGSPGGLLTSSNPPILGDFPVSCSGPCSHIPDRIGSYATFGTWYSDSRLWSFTNSRAYAMADETAPPPDVDASYTGEWTGWESLDGQPLRDGNALRATGNRTGNRADLQVSPSRAEARLTVYGHNGAHPDFVSRLNANGFVGGGMTGLFTPDDRAVGIIERSTLRGAFGVRKQ